MMIAMITCAIHEQSVVQLTHVASLLLNSASSLTNNSRTSSSSLHHASLMDVDVLNHLETTLNYLKNAATEPRLALPVSAHWLATVPLPKRKSLETKHQIESNANHNPSSSLLSSLSSSFAAKSFKVNENHFQIRVETDAITIGKSFFLRFTIPKGYVQGPDDFIGLYDAKGVLIDWYKATEERRKNGLEWVPSKTSASSAPSTFHEGEYLLRYVSS